jgi:choline-sulfatase
MLTRRSVLSSLAAAPLQRRRPNFLFILADDHAAYALGAEGNQLAVTPNLDGLAAAGTRFTNHYCNSPVCTPSRQSFFTGQLPHAAGVTQLRHRLSPGKPTLARQFKRAGYHTAVFGKMHFNQPAADGLHGFDVVMTEDRINHVWNTRPRREVPRGSYKPRWQPFKDPARIWLNADALPFPAHEPDMKGSFIASLATEYIAARRGHPFALWVSFMEPHSPFDFPAEDRGRFPPSAFAAPRVGPEDPPQIPNIFRDLSDADKRGINAAYYTSVHFLDRSIGRVLEALRKQNLEDDTFIVYMADHGYCLGHHGRFEKHCGYEQALRVPLIMRFPGRVRSGVVDDFTEHIDVPATIVDVMNLDPLPVAHGHSLRPYLEGRPHPARRTHIFSEYYENEEAYIRDGGYKLIYCTGRRARDDGYITGNPTPGPYTRLYDLRLDPGEFADISAREPETVRRLKGLMLDRFRSTHPGPAADLDGYLHVA